MAKLKYKSSNGVYTEIPFIVTNEISILQHTGQSTEDTMSQKVITDELGKKQDRLISGINIKTINGESLLGSGNIEIAAPEIPGEDVETLRVTLVSNQSTYDPNLMNASVKIVNTSGGSTIDQKSWGGSELVFSVPRDTSYRIEVSDVTGYKTPASQTYTAQAGGSRSASFKYESEKVTITLTAEGGSSMVGQTIYITRTNDGGELVSGGGPSLTAYVAYGTEYKIVVSEKSGYITPDILTYTAGQNTRTVSLEYKKEKLGVFILRGDGELYTYDEWDTGWNSMVSGVACLYQDISFVIGPKYLKDGPNNVSYRISKDGNESFDELPVVNEDKAINDLDGQSNTQKLINIAGETIDDGSNSAQGMAVNYTFKHGQKGYLPSYGELNRVIRNISEIDQCLLKIGGDVIRNSLSSYNIWSSTRAEDSGDYKDIEQMYALQADINLIFLKNSVNYFNAVRPFAKLK